MIFLSFVILSSTSRTKKFFCVLIRVLKKFLTLVSRKELALLAPFTLNLEQIWKECHWRKKSLIFCHEAPATVYQELSDSRSRKEGRSLSKTVVCPS